jgi:ArsR family transcriptional regulator, arsenate/arsenite/antimonite-responsive transcriptional repressor / arsenate reductase (thioredoxin)
MDTDWPVTEGRARVYAALGEPVRLAIVDVLGLGDASPGEIGAQFGLPTNLVAHHLGVLQDAGLIERGRSEGDARRTYVRLRPDMLTGSTGTGSLTPLRVVFVCTHNSARSQLAAALWKRRSPIPATSAGTQPADVVHPRAITTANRHGLSLGRPRTAHVGDVVRANDLVIAVCDNAHEHLPAGGHRLHWSVLDPAPADTDDAFEAAFVDIAARIDRVAPLITGSAS